MAKLYRVELKLMICVLADDEEDAATEAIASADVEMVNGFDDVQVTELTDVSELPGAWRDVLPYGLAGKGTCAQILSDAVDSDKPDETEDEQVDEL